MSVKVSSWVWHGEETADVAGNDMILLLALADVADDNGNCRFMTDDDDMTYSGLARKARVDRSTAIRVIARLRKANLVEQVKGTRVHPNEFAILVPWRKGGELPLVGKVASETSKVASDSVKGGTSDVDSSYRRIDVDVARKRASRISDDFVVTPEMRAWADAEVPGLDVAANTAEFIDYWRGKSGKDASKQDWVATWRNWMRRAHRWNMPAGGVPSSAPADNEYTRRRDEWLAARGVTYEEYRAHKDEDGWLESLELRVAR